VASESLSRASDFNNHHRQREQANRTIEELIRARRAPTTMRQLAAAVAVAAAGVLVAGCGGSDSSSTAPKPLLTRAALQGLLLPLPDIDTALGVTGTTIDKTFNALQPDQMATAFTGRHKFPFECVYVTEAGVLPIYSGSGYTTAIGEHDVAPQPPGSNDPPPEATQFVVLFPSADQANAFFTASSQRWPACANRGDTIPGDADYPDFQWKVGPVSNANGMLTTTAVAITSIKGQPPGQQSCQRALTVRNNVAIDINACRNDDPRNAAVNIANQIAGKADKQ
jgi:hypothetical protein